MTIFNNNNMEFIWRGITLSGFGSSMYSVTQKMPSVQTIFGIGPDMITTSSSGGEKATKRTWQITATFHPMSTVSAILEQDNLNRVVDTLIVRDLNTGITTTYSNCYILTISYDKSSYERTVVWEAAICNGR